MIINNKEYILDKTAYELLQDNWKMNIENFKAQNTGIYVNEAKKLDEETIIRFVDSSVGQYLDGTKIIIDKDFLLNKYVSLTVNPAPLDLASNYITQCDLQPDLSYVSIKIKGE